MPHSTSRQRSNRLFDRWFSPILLLVMLICLAAQAAASALHKATSPLHQAWKQAHAAGAYTYDARATVTYRPDNTLANVGLSSRQDRFAISGKLDQVDQTIEMKLWSGCWARRRSPATSGATSRFRSTASRWPRM